MKIMVKSFFNGWHEVDEETAYTIALHLFEHSTPPNGKQIDVVNRKFQGAQFTEEELYARLKQRRTQDIE